MHVPSLARLILILCQHNIYSHLSMPERWQHICPYYIHACQMDGRGFHTPTCWTLTHVRLFRWTPDIRKILFLFRFLFQPELHLQSSGHFEYSHLTSMPGRARSISFRPTCTSAEAITSICRAGLKLGDVLDQVLTALPLCAMIDYTLGKLE